MLAEVLIVPNVGSRPSASERLQGIGVPIGAAVQPMGPAKDHCSWGQVASPLEAACKQIVTVNHQTLDVITSCLSISLDGEQPNPRGSPL